MRWLSFYAAFWCISTVCTAAQWFVAPDGNDLGTGSVDDPWQHIQYALDTITGSLGDQQYINITAGTYYERLTMDDDDSFESLVGEDAATTIIDAQQLERCLVTENLQNAEITRLTFQNGKRMTPRASSGALVITGENVVVHNCIVRWSQGLYQAGIFVAGPNTIHNCELYENETLDMNGNNAGIYVTYPAGAHVYNNYIHDNYNAGQSGAGGLTFFFTTAILVDNLVENNTSLGGAAGVLIRYGDPVFIGNTIRWNQMTGGDAVRIEGAQPIFENNLIVDNATSFALRVDEGYARNSSASFRLNTVVAEAGGVVWSGCPAPEFYAPITESIIWTNGASLTITNTDLELSYCCLSDTLFSGEGVLYDNPMFVAPQNGDYHLNYPDSPCIDAGNPNSDFCTEPWPHGCRSNIGAYGNTSQAAFSTILTCTPLCPTETPVPSATPTPEPTLTMTLPPTCTPSATPTDGTITVELWLDDTFLAAGERLRLRLALLNGGPTIEFDQYVCLEVYGVYYFYPSWQEVAQSLNRTLGAGSFIVDTILDLILPDPLTQGGPFHFYAILIDPESSLHLSELVVVGFFLE